MSELELRERFEKYKDTLGTLSFEGWPDNTVSVVLRKDDSPYAGLRDNVYEPRLGDGVLGWGKNREGAMENLWESITRQDKVLTYWFRGHLENNYCWSEKHQDFLGVG